MKIIHLNSRSERSRIYIFVSLFKHGFYIDFSSISEWTVAFFQWFFNDFPVEVPTLQNLQIRWPLQWICMLLQFRQSWFLMILMIFPDTIFGIVFWCVLASISLPFWHPSCIIFHLVSGLIFEWIVDGLFYRCWIKIGANKAGIRRPFPCLFRPCSAGGVFEDALAHFGACRMAVVALLKLPSSHEFLSNVPGQYATHEGSIP